MFFGMKCDVYFMALRKSEPSELRRQEAYQAALRLLPNSSIDGKGTRLPSVKQ
jgi:hypothetical protein